MIDPATGWFEIVRATNKSATSVQDFFHNTWLARYPQPQFIVPDNGNMGESKHEFKQMCDNYGIQAKPTNYKSQPADHKQMQSLSEYTKLSMTCSDHSTWKINMKI
jgi:hypothetical protein